MKALNLAFLILLATLSIYSQTFEEWGINPPEKNIFLYATAISSPKNTEHEAVIEAEALAITNLAQNIFVFIDTKYSGIKQRTGTDRSHSFELIEDNISTRVYLENIFRQTKIQKSDKQFIAYSLVYITHKDADEARRIARDEFKAMNVFKFFENNIPGITPFIAAENPEGYTSWLKNNTTILTFSGNSSSLNHFEAFIRNLFSGIILYSGKYDKDPAIFIYGSEKINRIAEVLYQQGIPFVQESPKLTVSASAKLGNLARMNPSVVYITGFEQIHRSYGKQTINNANEIFSAELIRNLQNCSKKNIQTLTINSHNSSDLNGILEYTKNSSLSGRYLIAFSVNTYIESGIQEFGISPHLFADAQIIVFDLLVREVIFSTSNRNGIPLTDQLTADHANILLRRLLPSSTIREILNSLEK